MKKLLNTVLVSITLLGVANAAQVIRPVTADDASRPSTPANQILIRDSLPCPGAPVKASYCTDSDVE